MCVVPFEGVAVFPTALTPFEQRFRELLIGRPLFGIQEPQRELATANDLLTGRTSSTELVPLVPAATSLDPFEVPHHLDADAVRIEGIRGP